MIIVSISSAMRCTISPRCTTATTSRTVTTSSISTRGQVGDRVVEPGLVALERLQRLVGPVEQPPDLLQLALAAAGVDVDDAHLLGRRHDRHVERAGDTLGGAVTGAGLARGHGRVGHEVHVGAGDAAAVGGDDDRAVHLGQLGQSLRAERRVDEEAARADRQHLGVVGQHEQRTGLGPHDPVDAVTQRSTGRRRERAHRACARWPAARDRRLHGADSTVPDRARDREYGFAASTLQVSRHVSPAAASASGSVPTRTSADDRRRSRASCVGSDHPREAEPAGLAEPARRRGRPDAARRRARPRRTPPGRPAAAGR